jgi:hypothetical protein
MGVLGDEARHQRRRLVLRLAHGHQDGRHIGARGRPIQEIAQPGERIVGKPLETRVDRQRRTPETRPPRRRQAGSKPLPPLKAIAGTAQNGNSIRAPVARAKRGEPVRRDI